MMELGISEESIFFSGLTVIVTVLLIALLRAFGKLPLSLMGPDFNLLTYGFLWDTSLKALRGQDFWPRFTPIYEWMNASVVLFMIVLLNLFFLGINLKLADVTERMEGKWKKNLLMKPLVLMLGVCSLIFFFFCQAAWEAEK